MDPREARIEELEAELAAARRTIDALVRRAEREARGQELDQVAVREQGGEVTLVQRPAFPVQGPYAKACY